MGTDWLGFQDTTAAALSLDIVLLMTANAPLSEEEEDQAPSGLAGSEPMSKNAGLPVQGAVSETATTPQTAKSQIRLRPPTGVARSF